MSPQLKSPLARILLYWAVLILVTACLLNGSLRPETPPVASPSAILTSTPIHLETRMSTAVQSSSGTPQPTTTLPYPMSDNILGDICFDFLRSLVGSTIVLDSAADLTALYEKVDRSKKCDDPVTRGSFDFTTQQIVGAVFTDQACDLSLRHESTELDDSARQRIITLHVDLLGDCPYELVYPVWFAIERPPAGYTTQIRFIK